MLFKVEYVIHCVKNWHNQFDMYIKLKSTLVETIHIHYIKMSAIYDTLAWRRNYNHII